MSPYLILGSIGGYFLLLLLIAWYTSRKTNAEGYFLGNKSSPWLAVALGMIGDSLSGVTFISVPGKVGTAAHFSYLQLVIGFWLGYFVIAYVLLPVYYRMNLTSIYTYLESRFGKSSQKTGALYFILSRLLGAAARLYLTASVIQYFVFDQFGIPFWLSVTIIIILILLYTYKGGIQTLVWTDTFQSLLLLGAVIFTIASITSSLDWSVSDMIGKVYNSDYANVLVFDWHGRSFWLKDLIGGMFISIAMTGLDQNMMQKNLSCPNLKDAQKNVISFSFVMVLVNVFFLSLGALLYMYSAQLGIAIPAKTDELFPQLALNHLGFATGIAFIIGLTASTFSSADSVLTTLTTSFYIDFMRLDKNLALSEQQKSRKRHVIHVTFAFLLLGVILLFKVFNNQAIIDTVFIVASYTYGPLLGLFGFGLLSKRKINDALSPVICLLAPVLTYVIALYAPIFLGGYQFGFELLALNGLITYVGLLLISIKNDRQEDFRRGQGMAGNEDNRLVADI
jgi:solute:Na+ symporter, SSS family